MGGGAGAGSRGPEKRPGWDYPRSGRAEERPAVDRGEVGAPNPINPREGRAGDTKRAQPQPPPTPASKRAPGSLCARPPLAGSARWSAPGGSARPSSRGRARVGGDRGRWAELVAGAPPAAAGGARAREGRRRGARGAVGGSRAALALSSPGPESGPAAWAAMSAEGPPPPAGPRRLPGRLLVPVRVSEALRAPARSSSLPGVSSRPGVPSSPASSPHLGPLVTCATSSPGAPLHPGPLLTRTPFPTSRSGSCRRVGAGTLGTVGSHPGDPVGNVGGLLFHVLKDCVLKAGALEAEGTRTFQNWVFGVRPACLRVSGSWGPSRCGSGCGRRPPA